MFNPNLLTTANRLIPFEEFEYKEFDTEIINEMGIKVPSYKEAIKLKGSIQPIDSSIYTQMGLSLEKEYFKVWTNQTINTLINKKYADIIIYKDFIYSVKSITNWNNYNKWTEILIVKERNV